MVSMSIEQTGSRITMRKVARGEKKGRSAGRGRRRNRYQSAGLGYMQECHRMCARMEDGDVDRGMHDMLRAHDGNQVYDGS